MSVMKPWFQRQCYGDTLMQGGFMLLTPIILLCAAVILWFVG